MLHGRIPHPGCIHEAARKLATIGYVTRQMEGWITKEIFYQFKDLPPDMYTRIFGEPHEKPQADDAAG